MCERVFAPDDDQARWPRPVTYESFRDLAEFPVVAFSVAYELEIAGLIRMLEASGIGALRCGRSQRAPVVLAGGPLTFSNPLPLAPFVDAVVMGEAEDIIAFALETACSAPTRAKALDELARHPNIFVPALHGTRLPPIAACQDGQLPAKSAIVTPHTELSGMFLVETERGCSRGCAYCVMRRTTNGGMRLVPQEVILGAVPANTRRVGLVGAAVSDHPRIVDIVRALAERGCEVGLSSLRPDRLKEEFVAALKLGGYKTLTTALDGASQRLRDLIQRRGREQHYLDAAERARRHGMKRVKLYLMLGLPGEGDADVDECVRLVTELSRIVPVAIGVSPFCSKRNTPLDRMPYAGVDLVRSRLHRLRTGLKGRAEVRSTSARWAWVEHVLAQGGEPEALAVFEAVAAGGRFSDYRRAFARLGHNPSGDGYSTATIPALASTSRRRLNVVLSAV
jgi:radical SAM superfamily enzyme YgiQ (UPF0313 family)